MTANASSLSAPARPEPLAVDLVAVGRLAPLPAALLGGRDHDLLSPLRCWNPAARGGGGDGDGVRGKSPGSISGPPLAAGARDPPCACLVWPRRPPPPCAPA